MGAKGTPMENTRCSVRYLRIKYGYTEWSEHRAETPRFSLAGATLEIADLQIGDYLG